MSSSNNQSEANKFENFDTAYAEIRNEAKLHEELEKIEIAYVKTVEKYGEYADCKSFAEYLRTIEKVFTEAKFRNWDAERNKDALIQSKIKMLSENNAVGGDVLNSIYDDFKKVGTDVSKIYEVVNMLLEKYKDESSCKEFILYLQYLFINFENAEREKIGMQDLKDRLVHARMEVLSSDGNPELYMLEKIYSEFKIILSSK